MVAPEFTIDGIIIQTFDEIFEELAEGYRAIYGQDINLDQDSPDGQRVGIAAKVRLDMQTFAAQLYSQIDPDFSAGDFQNKIIKWSGIERRPATKSTSDVTITTDRNITLETGYTVKDTTGQEWDTTDENSLVTGANAITLTAVLFGNIEAAIDTITEPSTIILGVLSVTNSAIAAAGIDEETDEELRIRRNKSLENAAFSTTGGLFAKLANLSGVTEVVVYENDTDTPDQLRDPSSGSLVAAVGMPAHSLWCVIEGGEVADITETIAKNKTGGVALRGVEEATFSENINNADGSVFIFIHEVKYDRPSDKTLYVECTATRKDASQAIDLDLIKTKIAEKEYPIHDDALATELYAFGYQAGTNFVLTDMKISDDDITYTDDDLSSDFDEIWKIETASITVTEVV